MVSTFDNGTIRVQGAGRFSPVRTFECGQCFRWFPDKNGGYTGVAFGKAANIKECNGDIYITCQERDFHELWRSYFDLDRDYDALDNTFCTDDFMERAVRFSSGMRILRQEPWEALISFILSQCNNIKRIRSIISTLCSIAGGKIVFLGGAYDTFPGPLEIASLGQSELQRLKAGYRAPYIVEAGKAVLAGDIDFEKLRTLSTEDARREVMRLPGVGEKVANCFLLFGLQKLDAFPVDVWIKKAMAFHPAISPSRFGEFAGIAQQYIFYYARETGLKIRRPDGEGDGALSCV